MPATVGITPMRYSDPFHAIKSFGSLVSFGLKKRVQNAGTSTSDRDIKLTPLNYNNNTRRVKSNWFWTCAHHFVQRKGREFIQMGLKRKQMIFVHLLELYKFEIGRYLCP